MRLAPPQPNEAPPHARRVYPPPHGRVFGRMRAGLTWLTEPPVRPPTHTIMASIATPVVGVPPPEARRALPAGVVDVYENHIDAEAYTGGWRR